MAGSASAIPIPTSHGNSAHVTATGSINSQSLEYAGHVVGNWSVHHLTSPLSANSSDAASTGVDGDKSPWSFGFSVVMATILSISAFATVVGNGMVLTVIYRHRGMRTRTNLFLVNLAVADFLVGVTAVPFSTATIVEGGWVFGEAICSLNGWMNGLCLITSIHTLMYIGINKYFSICRPLSNPIQLQHIVAMMAMAWIWGAFCATITVWGLNTVIYKPGTSQCGPDYPKDARGYAFHGIIHLTVIILPFCTLLFCYIRMFREIKRHSERLRNNTTVEEDFILNQQKKVAVTLFIVLATFIVMALPYHIYASYTTIKKDKENFSSYMNPVAYCFLYLNSMCNPIIYAFRSPAFREGYKEILCQTPNYVIRDDFNVNKRATRGDSIVPSGRTRVVVSSSSTATDSNESPEVRSPAPLLLSSSVGKSRFDGGANGNNVTTNPKPRRLFNLQKQQTMKELIRSSRRVSGPLVIRRDGDVIVVKSGKIVSVRRESDSSSAMSPRRLSDAKEVPYGNSIAQMIFSQLTLGAAPRRNEEDADSSEDHANDSNARLLPHGSENGTGATFSVRKPNPYSGSGDVSLPLFEGEEREDLQSDSANDVFLVNGVDGGGGEETCGAKPGIYELPRDDSYHSIEELSASRRSRNHSNSKRERLKDRRNAPDLTVQIYNEKNHVSKPSSMEHLSPRGDKSNDKNKDNRMLLALPALSNMAAGVASATTDVLLGMPLTPFTRNMLTKSDMQLDRTNPTDPSSSLAPHPSFGDRRRASGASSIVHAHSSDNLYKPPRFARYPSLEHLDRPKPLFGTSKFHGGRNDKTAIV